MTSVSASSAAAETTTWGEAVARQLLDGSRCPVCAAPLDTGCCGRCGADLRGPIGAEVWGASLEAAAAVRARENLMRRVPVLPVGGPTSNLSVALPVTSSAAIHVSTAGSTSVSPQAGSTAAPSVSPPSLPPTGARSSGSSAPQGSATLQSVLATAGAGLFAVAAIVFTYFNPDLADRALRSVIVGLITLLFVGGAWLLSRRGLRFSAEAVGGLGLVFAGLDVHAVAQLAAPEVDPWATAAAVTAAVSSVVLAAGRRRGIRVWQWAAVLALSAAPAMLGIAGGTPLAAAAGAIGAAFAAAAVVEWMKPSAVDRVSLTVVQLIASLSALLLLTRLDTGDTTTTLFTASGLLVLIAVHAVIAAGIMIAPLWSFGAGVAGAVAIVLAVYAVPAIREVEVSWYFAIVPAAASLALVVVGALVPVPARVPRVYLAGGALTVLAVPSLGLIMVAGLTGASTVLAFVRQTSPAGAQGLAEWGAPLGLAAIGAGVGIFGALAREHRGLAPLAAPAARVALAFACLAVLVLGCAGLLLAPFAIAVLLGSVVLVAAVLRGMPAPAVGRGIRPILLVAAHLSLAAAVMVAWRDASVVPVAGVATILALAGLAAARPTRWRFLYVGGGFAYALILISTALDQAGVGGMAQLCLTASAGLLVAIGATYLPRIGARPWQAILVVSLVPFGIGVLQVVVERSGWTALSTGLMFVLALSLLLTRRPGLTLTVRAAAAAMLVPTLAVVVVCLGAQILASSGSPVVLPVVAVLVALALASSSVLRDVLLSRGHDRVASSAARIAFETSTLLTAVIAVGLAVGREAAGLGTTLLVLLIVAAGAVAAARFAGRRYAWVVAAVCLTGALWCVWGIARVDLLEAYLLPPTLGAAVVGTLLTLRGRRATALVSAGLLVAIAPIVAVVALTPVEVDQPGLALRAGGLLLAAWALLGLDVSLRRTDAGARRRRLRALRVPILGAASLAAVAGPALGVRLGLDSGLSTGLHGLGLFLACLGASAAGAAALYVAARGIRRAAAEGSTLRTTRWLEAPAALALAAGTWCAIERDWSSIWPMWMLMIASLVAMVLVAARVLRGPTTAPPVWFLFAIAFVTGIVAWSPRDLRVEWFSLPLGAFLLIAGVLALRRAPEVRPEGRATPDSWPGRWSGSWALLAPGIVTMMSASIVSTFTDPLTWRAILVMVLALAAILVGSRDRLAAPFVLGLIVLPIENVFVFSVQIGRGIESMPWWITLAVMGAVLLIIAVTAERRTGEDAGVAARMRDLR
ncbi:SCO7613 C-terminal domain-containing membrane protein [Microbacterium sp.]|uniref:SCO7613 C-terminal domain-containing membrane protein n=1 Tax=Microbacterium sp. TaxID=51671 RepID=UPI0035670E77